MPESFSFPPVPKKPTSSVADFNFPPVPPKAPPTAPAPAAPVPPPVPAVPVAPEEPPSSLPIPPPQIDDDPYEIHTNKPPPSLPVNPFTNRPAALRQKEEPKKAPVSQGDPFEVLIAGVKPKKAEEKPKDPTANIPLKDLVAQQALASKPADPAPFVPPPVSVRAATTEKPRVQNPFAPKPAPTSPTAPVVAPAPVPAAPIAPAPGPAGFDPFSPSKDPFAAPSSASKAADPFAADFSADPFAAPAAPLFPPSKPAHAPAAPAVTADDFDIFEKPSKPVSKPVSAVPAAPAPAAAAAPALPASKPAATLPPPPRQAPAPVAVPAKPSTAQQPQQKKKSVDLLDDPFDSAPAPAPAATVHDSTFDDMDPFDVSTADDPFAPSHAADPFASDNTKGKGKGKAPSSSAAGHEDMFERFKIMYGVKDQHSDHESDLDHEHHDPVAGKSHNIYDSDFEDELDKHEATMGGAKSTTTELPAGVTAGQIMADGSTKELLDGEILTRLSTRSLLVKDWHDTYYVIKKGILFLYRTK